jgi:hypothetical protein
MRRPGGVVASAIILTVISLLEILGALGMALAASINRNMGPVAVQSAPAAPAPLWMPDFMYGMAIFFLLLAGWGIATAIGIIRLRRWARYSILIIGGGMAFLGLTSMSGILLFLAVPLPTPRGLDAAQAHSMQMVARFGLFMGALAYAAVLAIGIWWLVYFNRKSVRSVFAGASGQIAESRPVLISVFAVLSILGAPCCVAAAFIPVPALFFGTVIGGGEKIALFSAFALLELVIGIGLWRMAEWARRLALGFLALGAVNLIVYLVRPSLMLKNMAEVYRAMQVAQPQFAPHFQNILFAETFGLSLVFIGAIAYMLHYYRGRFVEPNESLRRPPLTPTV